MIVCESAADASRSNVETATVNAEPGEIAVILTFPSPPASANTYADPVDRS